MPRKKGQRKKAKTTTSTSATPDSSPHTTPPHSPTPSESPSPDSLPKPSDPAVDQLEVGYLLLLLETAEATPEDRIQYALAALDRSKQEAVAEAERLKQAVRKSKLSVNAA